MVCPPIGIKRQRPMPRRTEQPYLPFEDAASPAPIAGAGRDEARGADRLARARLSRTSAGGEGSRRAVTRDRPHPRRASRPRGPSLDQPARRDRSHDRASHRGAGPLARGFAAALARAGAGSRRAGLRRVSEAEEPTSESFAIGPGFHRALQRTFEEIRAAGLTAAALPARAFDDPRKLKELKGILSRYDEDLAAGRFIDSAAVLRRAAGTGRSDNAPGGARYLVVDDSDLTAVEREILEKVSARELRGPGLRRSRTLGRERFASPAAPRER